MSESVKQGAASPGGGSGGMSLRDLELINIAIHSTKGNMNIDMEKFAKMAGYKGVTVASTTWSRVKRNLQKVVPVVEPEEAGEAGTSFNNDGKKRKRGAKEAGGGESNHEAGTTPKKQALGKRVKKSTESGDKPAAEPKTPKNNKTLGKKAAKSDDASDGSDAASKSDDIHEKSGPAAKSDGAVEKPGPTAVKDAAKFTPINEVTPDNDEPATLGCITVKGTNDEVGPAIKKGGKGASGKKMGAKHDEDNAGEVEVDVGNGKSKKDAAVRGKAADGSDATDNDFDDGKSKGRNKAGKSKEASAAKSTQKAKTDNGVQEKAPKDRVKSEDGFDEEA